MLGRSSTAARASICRTAFERCRIPWSRRGGRGIRRADLPGQADLCEADDAGDLAVRRPGLHHAVDNSPPLGRLLGVPLRK